MSYADERPGGIRPITADDVSSKTWFRGVVNFGSDSPLSFVSSGQDVRTETILAGARIGFAFRATAVPAASIYAYIDYDK